MWNRWFLLKVPSFQRTSASFQYVYSAAGDRYHRTLPSKNLEMVQGKYTLIYHFSAANSQTGRIFILLWAGFHPKKNVTLLHYCVLGQTFMERSVNKLDYTNGFGSENSPSLIFDCNLWVCMCIDIICSYRNPVEVPLALAPSPCFERPW